MNRTTCCSRRGGIAALLILLLLGSVLTLHARAEDTTYVSLRVQLPETFQGISFVLTGSREQTVGTYTVEADGLLNLYVPEDSLYGLTPADPDRTLPEPGEEVLRGDPADPPAGGAVTVSVELGPAWAGVLFDAATDAGSYPEGFAVDGSGVLTAYLEESRICSLSPSAAVDEYGIALGEDTPLAGEADPVPEQEEQASPFGQEESPAEAAAQAEESRTEVRSEIETDGSSESGEETASAEGEAPEPGAGKNRPARIFFFAVLALLALSFLFSRVRRARQISRDDPEEEE